MFYWCTTNPQIVAQDCIDWFDRWVVNKLIDYLIRMQLSVFLNLMWLHHVAIELWRHQSWLCQWLQVTWFSSMSLCCKTAFAYSFGPSLTSTSFKSAVNWRVWHCCGGPADLVCLYATPLRSISQDDAKLIATLATKDCMDRSSCRKLYDHQDCVFGKGDSSRACFFLW